MSNIDVVRGFYEAVERGDLDAALADVAPDCAWTEADGFPYAGTFHGPEGVREHVFTRIGSDWDGFRFDVDDVLDAGDAVVGTGTYSGTFKATGRSMRARVAHVWKLRDGQVVSFEQFVDTLRVADALEG
jgi:ketosteroid isomerase-like protein